MNYLFYGISLDAKDGKGTIEQTSESISYTVSIKILFYFSDLTYQQVILMI